MSDTALFRRRRFTGDSADAFTGIIKIMAVQISANGGNVDVELVDATTDTGGDDLTYNVVDGRTRLYDYTRLGGIVFETALTVDTTANAVIQIWTDR